MNDRIDESVKSLTGRPGSKPAVPQKFAHAVFYTSRYAQMKHWYLTVLGAHAVHERGQEIVFMTYDDEHHRVAIASKPGLADRPPDTAGLAHLAFTYGCLADLLSTYLRLKGSGILPDWCVNHGPTTSLYYFDPDRNRIELQVDNFSKAEEASEFMRGDEFGKNFEPRAATFDPDKMASLLQSGAEEPPLKVRQNIIRMIAHGEL